MSKDDSNILEFNRGRRSSGGDSGDGGGPTEFIERLAKAELKIENLKESAATKTDMVELRGDIKTQIAKLSGQIETTEAKLGEKIAQARWTVLFGVVAIFGLFIAVTEYLSPETNQSSQPAPVVLPAQTQSEQATEPNPDADATKEED